MVDKIYQERKYSLNELWEIQNRRTWPWLYYLWNCDLKWGFLPYSGEDLVARILTARCKSRLRYICAMTFQSLKIKGSSDMLQHNWTWKLYSMWKKPDIKGHVLYDTLSWNVQTSEIHRVSKYVSFHKLGTEWVASAWWWNGVSLWDHKNVMELEKRQ